MSPPDLKTAQHTLDYEEIRKPRPINALVVAIGATVILEGISALLWISPTIMPESDPDGLYRVTLLRATNCLGGLLFMCLGLFMIDLITPGRWLRSILNDTRAVGAVVCVSLYLMVQLFLG